MRCSSNRHLHCICGWMRIDVLTKCHPSAQTSVRCFHFIHSSKKTLKSDNTIYNKKRKLFLLPFERRARFSFYQKQRILCIFSLSPFLCLSRAVHHREYNGLSHNWCNRRFAICLIESLTYRRHKRLSFEIVSSNEGRWCQLVSLAFAWAVLNAQRSMKRSDEQPRVTSDKNTAR